MGYLSGSESGDEDSSFTRTYLSDEKRERLQHGIEYRRRRQDYLELKEGLESTRRVLKAKRR
jgi:hypothetical protein